MPDAPLPLQPALFDEPVPADDRPRPRPAAPDDALRALAARLRARWGDRLALGTSSWHFPGWQGLVWDRRWPEAALSRDGLAAYAAHPLFSTVSLDRAYHRPLEPAEYARLAAQAGGAKPGFRFVVKAPACVSDALLRDGATGRATGENPRFLDPATALALAARPAADGLGDALGALVFQISPLPPSRLARPDALADRLDALWAAVRPALPPGALLAVELRDAALATPAFALRLKAAGVRWTLGLHDRMPDVPAQLPMLRATWPGDLVCRWNLQRGQRYADARDAWAPFDRLRAPDVPTRQALARLAAATLDAGQRVFITVNNKAEGCAPRSVRSLAEALDALAPA